MEIVHSCQSPILKGAVGTKGRSAERGQCGQMSLSLAKPPVCSRGCEGASLAPPLQTASSGLGEGQPDSSVFIVGPATLVPFQCYLPINLDTSLSFPKACWTSEKIQYFFPLMRSIQMSFSLSGPTNNLSPLSVQVDA